MVIVEYVVIVIALVILSSIALGFVLYKNNLLNLNSIVAISCSSIIISIAFPFIFSAIFKLTGSLPVLAALLPVVMLMVYLTLIFMFTILISSIISKKQADALSKKFLESNFTKFVLNLKERVSKTGLKASKSSGINLDYIENYVGANSAAAEESAKNAAVEESLASRDAEAIQPADGPAEAGVLPEASASEAEPGTLEAGEDNGEEKNILEKSVDSEQIIDTMCIETFISETINNGEIDENTDIIAEIGEFDSETDSNPDSDDVESPMPAEDSAQGIEQYIDTAFRLKANGDLEGAILHYMYALDSSPDRELVFWIILDICVLYKSLGQTELARDILESYIAGYGDVMDIAVKNEIVNNL